MTIGLQFVGIGAAMAMSLGTAITVSFLALFSIYFRKAAITLGQKSYAGQALILMPLLGGVIIFLLGLSLLNQSTISEHPLF